ncbi:indolepyruvate ferredoxin oxidoreductase family protein [Rhodoblastus sp. 17X3]|uniref:indolepyruvate ferredoxin oxidoreductase family protein n=1 Tax=Rhodoblastus sp. 17X3 TaxID=3047026 RepID=UPI0024B7B3CB|nr:indolepyruvate ferredoxin oxidoreductase family protein [Rhodoblastus sp. 17X3]MDI9849662.1 indolepyruvate ferredoxin oxidoreductase family protein [Rhodoblastus sp. 17X3]
MNLPLSSRANSTPEHGAQAQADVRFLYGTEALALLPILQHERDLVAGLNTAGFISGYRGSPLGALDQTLWRRAAGLKAHHVHFEPGLNEELAATAVWGSQQVNLFEGALYDGVFALWYGKGPGVDRSMDALKHANAAGTSRFGGVLAVAGDDHAARSSTLPHQSEHMFAAAMIPVLNPSSVQEILDFGLHGWAMSRYSGCWVALKATGDTVESYASVSVDPFRVQSVIPEDFVLPADGVHIRWPDTPQAQELRLQHVKVYAAMAYARANRLDRIVLDSPVARLGIVSTGKSYLDVRQALDDLHIDEARAAEIGLRLYKVGMNWPLDAEGMRQFAQGLEEILVVEEKRQLIEYQLKEHLYNWRDDVRPRVIGKYADEGEWEAPLRDWQLPAAGELTPTIIARVIVDRIARFHRDEALEARLALLAANEARPQALKSLPLRQPHYCSGCPHNTSTTVLPEGSRAMAGIGCHYMATWISADTTKTFSQMGGEGVPWIGQAPFTSTPHVFANLGDGTYQHSGLLAIRAAVAARTPITYKILYNDAVAMTGGQKVEGALTVPMIARQLLAERVARVVVVTDQPQKYVGAGLLPREVEAHDRRDLMKVEKDLRKISDVTAIIYDQTCAAEKRRRRKRKEYPDPAIRAFINERVCENCGDCSAQSNCMAVVPVETPFGRKRRIDQSACNKDYSCIEGFCPSFVTVHGGALHRAKGGGDPAWIASLPEPEPAPLAEPCSILITGVGGTGVVTLGALIGAAAAREGKNVTALDMAGLAQKGGPVTTHIRIAPATTELHATRIASGETAVLIGCDLVVSASPDTIFKLRPDFTRAVVNNDFSITSEIVRTFAAEARTGDLDAFPDPVYPHEEMESVIAEACGPGRAEFLPATRLATALIGDSIATNPFLLGFAVQKGLLPLSTTSILQAIEDHGVAVSQNRLAFNWGRRAAHDFSATTKAAGLDDESKAEEPLAGRPLDAMIKALAAELSDYQNAAFSARFLACVAEVAAAERRVDPASEKLARAFALGLYKLMAAKDEYEVARLYARPEFLQKLRATFEGDFNLSFYFAPPILTQFGAHAPRKRRFGAWALPALRLLSALRFLRGSWLDPFRFSPDRKLERELLRDYEQMMSDVAARLSAANLDVATELAALPQRMRGYGPVKARYVAQARKRQAALRKLFDEAATTERPSIAAAD